MTDFKTNLAPGPDGGRWFTEDPAIGLGSALTVKIERVIEHFRSDFQEIAVMDTVGYGRMLVLDGIIQLTEADETGYHEMIAHVPLMAHPHPKDVLVIGGGDGGTVRETLKHPSVERVTLCEIDPEVIRVSRDHLPGLAGALDDPRVEIRCQDGAALAAERRGDFDLIIVDSSDPIGPAEVLFQAPFFQAMAAALREGGLVVSQAESFFYHPDLIGGLYRFIPDIFPKTAYYTTQVPTYPSGLIGFTFCSLGPPPWPLADPTRAEKLGRLDYYSPAVHRAAFSLPPRALRLLPRAAAEYQANLPA